MTRPATETTPESHHGSQPTLQEMNALVDIFHAGRHLEAATLAHSLTIRYPTHALGWNVLGRIFWQSGRPADALAPMQRAVALSPCDASAHTSLGSIFRVLGKLDEAEASFRSALQIRPDLIAAHYNLGNTLKDCGKLNDAAACYRRAIEISPDYADAHNNLGSLLNTLGRPDEAAVYLQRALEIQPDSVIILNNLGNTFKELGRLDEAEQHLQRALLIDPINQSTHFNLGNLTGAMGNPDAAAAHFNHCLENDPEDHLGVRLLLSRLGIEPVPARASAMLLNRLYAKRAKSWEHSNGYRGHEMVAQALRKHARQTQLELLDAGCGTGLVGELVGDMARTLDGIDMSPAMLERAAEKNIYDQLHQGDLAEFMASHPEKYDAITCAATLIHFGDLAPVFNAAAAALKAEGLLIFTLFPNNSHHLEIIVAPDSEYANGGCYAHSPAYVRRLAEATGFTVEALDAEVHEYSRKGSPVMALAVVLKRKPG